METREGRRIMSDDGVESWSILQGDRNGDPLIVRINTAYKTGVHRADRSIRIGIAVPLLAPQQNGLPSEEEQALLAKIEAKIVEFVADRAVLVGVITASNVREYLLYSKTHDWLASFHARLRAAAAPHEVQVIGDRDPGWDMYEQFAPPN
jgi:hypothetical protein